MAKGRRGKRPARKRGAEPEVKPGARVPETEATPPWVDGVRPAGQRLYDMPYSAPAPRLVNPDLGLHSLMARAGHNAAYTIDVTLLDAPDHRLIRSGVLLAHRVLGGRGEWFLTAPDWGPLLPRDRVELMGDAELPDEFADLIRPLRRRATLGPVAGLQCERREFALRDDQGSTRALLRDDKVTVRRGGLATARYRQLMITPVGPGLTDDQHGWVDRALTQTGGNRVPTFARLATRLGAPATGPTDIPEPTPFDGATPFRRFVSQLLGLRLRRIVEADLAIRGGDLTATGQLMEQAAQLRLELQGLSTVLDADWVEDLYDELDWITVRPAGSGRAGAGPGPDDKLDPTQQLVSRLRSERYLTLLERLVNAVRSPKLSDSATATHPGGQPAEAVLDELVATVLARLRRQAGALTVDSSDRAWLEAQRSLSQVNWAIDLAAYVLADRAGRLRHRLTKPQRLLTALRDQLAQADQAVAAVSELSPEAAFAAGRAYEQQVAASRRLRQDFVDQWAKTAKKLDA